MKKGLYILVFCFAGCASQAPLDDAYYWPEKRASVVKSEPVEQTTTSSQSTPSMEIVNQQDTTITVKIKR